MGRLPKEDIKHVKNLHYLCPISDFWAVLYVQEPFSHPIFT